MSKIQLLYLFVLLIVIISILGFNKARNTYNQISLVFSIIDRSMSDEEKAIIIWEYMSSNTRHQCVAGTSDPIKVLELGYGCCDETARALKSLWMMAGLDSRICYMTFHTVPEVYYDGDWHMFDPDQKVFYLEEDNKTIASVEEIVENPKLITRTVNERGYSTPEFLVSHYLRDYRQDSCPKDLLPPFL